MTSRLALLAAVAAGCGGDPVTVVVVEVSARPAVAPLTSLEVTVRNESASVTDSYDVDGRDLPVTFSITPTGRSGSLDIEVVGIDADGLVRAQGTARAEIVTDARVDVDLLLDPGDFVVNTEIAGSQRLDFSFAGGRGGRQIAAGADGRFIIAFVNDCATLGRCDLFARLFDGDGQPRQNEITMDPDEFIANLSDEIADVPAAAVGTAGMFLAYETGTDVRGVALTPGGGHAAGSEILLSTSVDQFPSDVEAAGLGAGDYVAVWSDDFGSSIRARLINSAGEPRVNPVSGNANDFLVSTTPGGVALLPSVASTGEPHGFVVVWRTDDALRARFFAGDATPRTAGEVIPASYGASATVSAPHVAWRQGGAAITWWAQDPALAGLQDGAILLRVYAPPGGTPVTPERVLARPSPGVQPAPDVAVLPDGTMGVAWHDCGEGGDSAGCGIRFQALRSSGLPIGDPMIANTTIDGDQWEPAIAAVGDDAFAITWTDESSAPPDTSGSAIRARLIYPARDPNDGRRGARCGSGSDAACADGLVCMAGSEGTPYCHEVCDPDGPAPQCPDGGICTTAGTDSACVF